MSDQDHSIFKEIVYDLETVKRHIAIIKTLLREQPAGIIKMAKETNIPEHKIRYSLRILEKEGVISPSREGAILTPEFIENRDAIMNSAKLVLDEMEGIYSDLKSTLAKK
ncbi:ribosomal protein [uncultured archaeon]|nr:ribosomal protein [uncultured archaeon]